MKQILIIIVLMSSLFAQVSLKGFIVGSQVPTNLESQLSDIRDGTYEYKTTMAGHNGMLYVRKISDGRVAQVVFIPELLLSTNEIEDMVAGLENHYGVDYELVNQDGESGELEDTKSGVLFKIIFKHVPRDSYDGYLYDVSIGFSSIFLIQVLEEEESKKDY